MLPDWLRRSLGIAPPCSHTAAVMALADEVDSAAFEVRKQLKGYLDKPDPFVAMAADVLEKRQEANIWRGPPNESQ